MVVPNRWRSRKSVDPLALDPAMVLPLIAAQSVPASAEAAPPCTRMPLFANGPGFAMVLPVIVALSVGDPARMRASMPARLEYWRAVLLVIATVWVPDPST